MLHFLSAFSISIWVLLISRIIAFGFRTKKIFVWKPVFNSNHWYNLTPIWLRIPSSVITYFYIVICIFSAMYLFLTDHLILQLSIIILTISLHTFIPSFIVHIHADVLLFVWSIVNVIGLFLIICATVSIELITGYVAVFSLIPLFVITIWGLIIQTQLRTCIPIVYKGIEEKRKPRII